MIQQLVGIGFIVDLERFVGKTTRLLHGKASDGPFDARQAGWGHAQRIDPEANEQKGGCRIPGHFTAHADRLVLVMGSLDDVAHEMDNGRMQIVMAALHQRVASVHSQQILDKIIR
jgi:hypothetical protein